MRFVGVFAIFIGLYLAIKVGIMGQPLKLAGASSVAGTGTGTLGGASSGAASGPGFSGGAPLNPNLFGVNAPFSAYGESVPGIASADQAGLSAFSPSSVFAHDYDYAKAAIAGAHVYLPGGSGQQYTYLGDQPGPWGHLYGFLAPGGGVIEFTHIEGAPTFAKGQTLFGGQFIGNVGAGPYSSQFWKGPHLSVIVDQAANTFLLNLQKSLGL